MCITCSTHFSALFHQPTSCNILQKGGQTSAICCAQQRFQYVVLKCCTHLAEHLKNVICEWKKLRMKITVNISEVLHQLLIFWNRKELTHCSVHKLLLTNFPHCLVGWMTFCPEWLTGSPSLDTSSLLYLWCYLVFFNGLWVVIPFLLLWHSWKEIEVMHTSVSTTTRKKKR